MVQALDLNSEDRSREPSSSHPPGLQNEFKVNLSNFVGAVSEKFFKGLGSPKIKGLNSIPISLIKSQLQEAQ